MGAVRDLADRYTAALFALDPIGATFEGVTAHNREVTDFSPDGVAARTALVHDTLRSLDALDPTEVGDDPLERRCARTQDDEHPGEAPREHHEPRK